MGDGSSTTYDVVLVTYNSGGCVAQSIAAVSSFFADREFGILVVDNASSDDSVEQSLLAAPNVVVLENGENVGFASAVNRAVRESSRDWVVLVNPDVSSIAGSTSALEATAADGEVAAIASRMTDSCGVLVRSCHSAPSPFTVLSESLALHARFPTSRKAQSYRMLDWDMESPRFVEDACGGFLALRRGAIEDVGLLDERFFLYFEETDWLLRARERGWKVAYTPEVCVVHASGSSSDESEETMSAYLLHSQYLYLRKHFGPVREWLTRLVLAFVDVVRWLLGVLLPRHREKARRAARRLRIHLGLGE